MAKVPYNWRRAWGERRSVVDQLEAFILPLVGGLVLYGIVAALVKAPGQALHVKFVKLGQLKGKSKAEIVAAVGLPNSVSAVANEKTVCQWLATGYHIALLFDGDICEGVTHEFLK
jgi:hypothetical protein